MVVSALPWPGGKRIHPLTVEGFYSSLAQRKSASENGLHSRSGLLDAGRYLGWREKDGVL